MRITIDLRKRQRHFLSLTGLTLIELLLCACIIFVLIGTFSFSAESALKIAKETALRNELQNIRMAIDYYNIINNRFPDSLEKLQQEQYIVRGSNSSIVIKQSFINIFKDKRGSRLLDPFMNRYQYDNATGRVWAGTKKYQSW